MHISNSNVIENIIIEKKNGKQPIRAYKGRSQSVEAFIRCERVEALEGNNEALNNKYTPHIGMEFKNKDGAHHFINFYAFLAGFEVAVTNVSRTTYKKRNNKIFGE